VDKASFGLLSLLEAFVFQDVRERNRKREGEKEGGS
jgi:hypothetical protein